MEGSRITNSLKAADKKSAGQILNSLLLVLAKESVGKISASDIGLEE